MKTKNNVQKTTLRTAAAIVSLVLLSLTVSAQGFWENFVSNNSFGEIAEAMVYPKDKPGTIKIENTVDSEAWYNKAVEEAVDGELRLENWMFRLNSVNTSTSENAEAECQTEDFANNFTIVEESDETLKLEDWMMK